MSQVNFSQCKIADMRRREKFPLFPARTYIETCVGEDGTVRVLPHMLTIRMPVRYKLKESA